VDLFHFNGDTTVLQSDTLYTPVGISFDLWRQGIVGGVGCDAGSSGLYAMSGSQTVTVEVIEVVPANSMILTPGAPFRMDQGDSLIFRASAKYTTTDEHLWIRATASAPYGWIFIPDSSDATPHPTPQNIPGCYGDLTCLFKATVAGTVKVYGGFSLELPATDSAMVHVDVTTCPWKDWIIDSPEVRRALVNEFKISADSQLERAGGIYRDSLGYLVVKYSVVPGTATQCRNEASIGEPGMQLVAIWHTHPIAPGHAFTNCPTSLPGRVAARGPSRPMDYSAQAQFGVPEYIIDSREVFRVTNNSGRHWWQSSQALKSKSWKSCQNWTS
jgi:hypothetical protein